MRPTRIGAKRRLVSAIAVVVALSVAAAVLASGVFGGTQKVSAVAFHDAMRKLWEDHATWTRLAIVSLVADLPDTPVTVDRLMRNQVDIGDAIRPFYGDAAGERLTALLKDHIAIAAEIVVAAKRGDQSAVDGGVARWFTNAEEIAVFLNSANPKHWDLDMLRHMMHAHLDLTLQEAVAQITGDYAGSVAAYDAVHAQILEMADMLSSGIVAQFPQLFNGPVPK